MSSQKRKMVQSDANWASEAEMQQMREKKRKLEEAEPYNDAAARRTAREVGMKQASRASLSDIAMVSLNPTPARLWSLSSHSSSEFVSEAGEDERQSADEQEDSSEKKSEESTESENVGVWISLGDGKMIRSKTLFSKDAPPRKGRNGVRKLQHSGPKGKERLASQQAMDREHEITPEPVERKVEEGTQRPSKKVKSAAHDSTTPPKAPEVQAVEASESQRQKGERKAAKRARKRDRKKAGADRLAEARKVSPMPPRQRAHGQGSPRPVAESNPRGKSKRGLRRERRRQKRLTSNAALASMTAL